MLDGYGNPRKKPLTSFFTGILGVAGYLGGGWYPTGSREGAAPFRQVGSDAGPVITPGTALQLAAVWANVRLIADTLATLPFCMSQPDDTGKLVEMTNSPIYRMLALKPNLDMTAAQFWTMVQVGLELWGNAYAVKGTVAGRVVSLTPLRPDYMTVYRDMDGNILYAYSRGSTLQIYTADEMVHFKAFGVDGLVGLSPVAMARQTLGRSLATDEASGALFLNGMSAGGFIEYAQVLSKEQREEIRTNIQKFVGSKNTGKIMVLEAGMKYNKLIMSAADSQMLETRQFNGAEVCRWFGTPPVLVGFVTKQSSWASSLESTINLWIKTALRPRIVNIEQTLQVALGLPTSTTIEFNMDDLERGDSAARAALYASGAQNGWMTRNRICRLENQPEFEGGDIHTVQSNLIDLSQINELGGQQAQTTQAGESTGGNSGKAP
jgi:HK97 family phage portal protein